jgi:hypothetical protein
MAAGVYNFVCEQGATFEKVLTLRDADQELYDFTGCTARMQVRKDAKATDVLISLTTSNGRLTLGGEAGTITFLISAADTSAIAREGIYDLEVETAGGHVYRLLKGRFDLDPEVTR